VGTEADEEFLAPGIGLTRLHDPDVPARRPPQQHLQDFGCILLGFDGLALVVQCFRRAGRDHDFHLPGILKIPGGVRLISLRACGHKKQSQEHGKPKPSRAADIGKAQRRDFSRCAIFQMEVHESRSR